MILAEMTLTDIFQPWPDPASWLRVGSEVSTRELPTVLNTIKGS